MPSLPLAEVEARFSAVLDDVTRTHDRVVVTRNGRPEVVILSIDDLAAIEDTLEILRTPGLVRPTGRRRLRERGREVGRRR